MITAESTINSTRLSDQIFTLGHSPDPDDAFMFYAIAANKIDLKGYRFEHLLEDIQTLNERATRGELHISAVSIHAYAYVADKYSLLPCGASMGDGYGPLIIAPEFDTGNQIDPRDWLENKLIAIPGEMTSAFLALRLYLGDFDYTIVAFDKIFETIKKGQADAGLIIHEGQLTYSRSGFQKVVDLGDWWKKRTGLPLPLGGNVLRKDIPGSIQRDLLAILRESIRFGLDHRGEALRHSMPYAREMDMEMASQFVEMYVNDFTLDYGEVGRKAIREFLGTACKAGYIDRDVAIEFVR